MTFKHRALFPRILSLFSFIFSQRTWTATMQRGLIRSTTLRPYVAPKCWYGFWVSPLNSTRSPGSCRNYQHANLRIEPTNDKTSKSAGRKYSGVHMNWLNWTAGGRLEVGKGGSNRSTDATIVALSRASGLQERRMDEQQYQTALKPIRSPHTRPEKYRGVGANRTNFFSFSVCSEIWTIGTMATS